MDPRRSGSSSRAATISSSRSAEQSSSEINVAAPAHVSASALRVWWSFGAPGQRDQGARGPDRRQLGHRRRPCSADREVTGAEQGRHLPLISDEAIVETALRRGLRAEAEAGGLALHAREVPLAGHVVDRDIVARRPGLREPECRIVEAVGAQRASLDGKQESSRGHPESGSGRAAPLRGAIRAEDRLAQWCPCDDLVRQ